MTRHGESVFNVLGKIGGNPSLSPKGHEYAEALYTFINEEESKHDLKGNLNAEDSTFDLSRPKPKLRVITSTLKRALETAEYFDESIYDISHVRFLNEIYSGIFEEMTYPEIIEKYPREYKARLQNKLLFRYPGTGGESLVDVIERLRPVIIELERMRVDMLVVSHQVIMRTLLAYFTGESLEDMPRIQVPLHTIYKLEPKPYGADLSRCIYE